MGQPQPPKGHLWVAPHPATSSFPLRYSLAANTMDTTLDPRDSASKALGELGAANELHDLDAFLHAFDTDSSFAYSKINHGFWEALANVEAEMGWPSTDDERSRADKIALRPHFFVGGFVDELTSMLQDAARDHPPSLHLAFELSAWPGDNQIIGTPFNPQRSLPLFNRFVDPFKRRGSGLLLKEAVVDGTIGQFFNRLSKYHVVLVGPDYLAPLFDLVDIEDGDFIVLHPSGARESRAEVEEQIRTALVGAKKEALVLLQAGTLAPYWILRLHSQYPGVRWVDGGLAFSICYPPDILNRPWGQVYRQGIVATYNELRGKAVLPERDLFGGVAKALSAVATPTQHTHAEVAFVEDKSPDLTRVSQLLETSAGQNHWTNRGPLHRALAIAYGDHFGLQDDQVVVPCANGGIALEALARLHDVRLRRRLRWAVSAFSFHNLGRGYFDESLFIDCDERGMLGIHEMAKQPRDSYDGIVVTNPFGMCKNFDAYREFASHHNKALLIDNAAGVLEDLPAADYQAFSLHHTKPYGVGEGGLAVLPAAQAEEFFELIDYGKLAKERSNRWLGNGKISDVACAFHLDRLERSPEWIPRYQMQAKRILHICERAGLRPLLPVGWKDVAMSLPFLADRPIAKQQIGNPLLVLGKYYSPLAPLPKVSEIYSRMLNVPSHPGVAQLDTGALVAMLRSVVQA